MFARLEIAALLYLFAAGLCHAAQVDISNISDFNPPSWGIGDPAISAHIDICVYSGSNSPAGGYAITVTSNPSGFRLVNGTHYIPYALYWDNGGAGNLGATSGVQLTSTVKLTGQLNANTTSSVCLLSNPTARLNLSVTQADMTAALAGTYTGTITLLLSPN